MNTRQRRPHTHPRHIDAEPLRFPAPFPPTAPARPAWCQRPDAAHDFLVPNPRPDLTFDPQTLRMIEFA